MVISQYVDYFQPSTKYELTMTVSHPDTSNLHFSTVNVWGLPQSPSIVWVDGQEWTQTTYDHVTKVTFIVFILNLSVMCSKTDNLELFFKYVGSNN